MSGPIKKGDLVMVVKPFYCCGYAGTIGTTFVAGVVRSGPLWTCRRCGQLISDAGESYTEFSPGDWIAVSRLKKIDPPAAGEYDRVPVRKAQPKKVPA